MTTEEKAKAYDEALDRMKHVVIVPKNEKALQALKETIFPELRESEDEKMRKKTINCLTMHNKGYIDAKDIDECITWLEKKKEQKSADDKAFEEWLDDWYQGSKEAGGDVVMSEAEFKNWSRGIRNMYQPKPTEWSEEDEKMRNLAIEWAETMFGQFSFVNMDSTDFRKIIAWLKSLRPQPKPSWSKEDETAFGDLMWCIEQARKSAKDENDMGNIWFAENWIKNRLKSLRPSWTPSEEQMSALLWCIAHLGSADRRVLAELYEHLEMYCK